MKKLFAFLLFLIIAFNVAIAEEQQKTSAPVSTDECYSLGDSANRVAEAKARLKELGYYAKEDKDSGPEFDRRFRNRVYAFQKYNGLKANGILDSNSLLSIMDESALSKSASLKLFKEDSSKEPENMLSFGLAYSSKDRSDFYMEVINESSHKTITAYQLVFKLYDAWDTPLHDGYYTVDTIIELKPGSKGESNKLYLEHPTRTYTIDVGFSKIRYADGTIYEIQDDDLFLIRYSLVEFK